MTDPTPFIPFNLPSIGPEEIEEVTRVLESGWVTTGPRTAQFEEEFRAYVGAPHALAVNSATAGLHLALTALDIGPGDEVITTPMTFCSTVQTILHTGATPVLADIRRDGNIDPASIRDRLTSRTRAIVPVHIAGLPCEMDTIWELARDRGLRVVEDAAHAIGTHYKGHPIGGGHPEREYRSDAVAFSFYATKNMTTGEGGMVVTHDAGLHEKMRVLCLHGISKDAWNRYSEHGSWYYEVIAGGFKYNLGDIQSAIGIHQLRKIERFTAARARIAARYDEAFGGMPEIETPPAGTQCRHAWHLYSLRLDLDRLGIDRAEFIRRLNARRIGASVHFIPIPLHPYFESIARRPENQCPIAMELYPRLVSLPLYPDLTDGQVDTIIGAVRDIVEDGRRKQFAGTGEIGRSREGDGSH